MYFVFDTETTGLPKGRGVSYSDDAAYSSCRLVSIAWQILAAGSLDVISEQYFMIKPTDYVVPQEATNIHGISHEQAMAEGTPFTEMVDALVTSLNSCKYLVAHNISFDFGVLLHELHCTSNKKAINYVFRMERKCTMLQGKKVMEIKKFPKLIELYVHFFKENPQGDLHNALVDTRACSECFRAMNKEDVAVVMNEVLEVSDVV